MSLQKYYLFFSAIFLLTNLCCAAEQSSQLSTKSTAFNLVEFKKNSTVGDWSEWNISFKKEETDKNKKTPVIRLRLTLTSIKEDSFYYTVQTKIKGKKDSRENIELNINNFLKRISGTNSQSEKNSVSSQEKVAVQLIDSKISGIKEKVILENEGKPAYLSRIISPDFNNLPVYLSTAYIDIILISFGTGSAPDFPINLNPAETKKTAK